MFSWLPAAVGSPALRRFAIRACLRPATSRARYSKTYRKTENVKITHENIPENVKS